MPFLKKAWNVLLARAVSLHRIIAVSGCAPVERTALFPFTLARNRRLIHLLFPPL